MSEFDRKFNYSIEWREDLVRPLCQAGFIVTGEELDSLHAWCRAALKGSVTIINVGDSFYPDKTRHLYQICLRVKYEEDLLILKLTWG